MIIPISLTLLTILYAISLHVWKDEINDWLDMHSPKWYTDCQFCRGVEFGVILGILICFTILNWGFYAL